MSVYLIRHPQPAISAAICYGQSDIPLAGPVAPLLDELRAQLPGHYRLISSPLQRCAELALALQAQVIFEPRLQELDFGCWEQQPWMSLGANTLDAWIASGFSGEIHGGESTTAFQQRIFAWCAEQHQHDEPMVVVTHAGVIRTILGHVHGWPLLRAMTHPLDFASVTRLDKQDLPR